MVYCHICDRNVEPTRKQIDQKYHEIWFFFVILTFGIGYIVYLIMKYRKKKNTCPYCEDKFDLQYLQEGLRG